MKPLLILAIFTLAACGVDGPPQNPMTGEPGLTISGEAEIGVSGSL